MVAGESFSMSTKHIKVNHLPSSKEIHSILYVKLMDEPLFKAGEEKKSIIKSNIFIKNNRLLKGTSKKLW